ncbi:hypothetical protein L195_g047022 [Trifolium pratense]|uniref:Uncharacterized protein n=1 Tax=Trifolium pratense TaxID=57577 RepID=A0A2K3MJG1_TRIPR|nr:hypothetical protein L195_g047022 [Trifolium pratense]
MRYLHLSCPGFYPYLIRRGIRPTFPLMLAITIPLLSFALISPYLIGSPGAGLYKRGTPIGPQSSVKLAHCGGMHARSSVAGLNQSITPVLRALARNSL